MRVDVLLMDLWQHSDDPYFLLELEACVDGLQHGVNFLFNGSRQHLRSNPNHGSARREPAALREVITRSIAGGHCVGPFPQPPWANLQIHPLGLVPKSSGGWRLVEDASFPSGDSVNDWTDSIPQQYEKWMQVVAHFARAGPNCFFLQWDKSDAYRSIPLREADQHLTGFHVPGFGFCFSITMPFGFAASAFLWKRYMDLFLLLLSSRLQIPLSDIHAWVDDCLLILSPCAAAALDTFSKLISTARRYNFFLHPTKLYLSRSVTYLGVTFDSTTGTLSIPASKLQQIRDRVRSAVSASAWTRTLAQQLLGSLHHVTRCLPLAKAFLGRLVAVLKVHHGPGRFPPPAWALDDLHAWAHILDTWSGTTVSRLLTVSAPQLRFHVDAFGGSASSSFAGIGLYCLSTGDFAMHEFSPAQLRLAHVKSTYSTHVLEFAAFPLLLSTFSTLVRGTSIEIFCDNDGASATAIKGYHPSLIAGGLCRLLASLCVSLDCHIVYSRVDSQDNLADPLSRGSVADFQQRLSDSGSSFAHSPTTCRSPPTELCATLQCCFFSEA